MSLGANLDTWGAAFANAWGAPVTWKGKTFKVDEKLDLKLTTDMVTQIAGANVGNPDFRRWDVSPSSIDGGLYPDEKDIITKVEGGATLSFTVIRREVPNVAGTDASIELIVYRTPTTAEQMDTAADGTPGAPKPMDTRVNPYA